MTHESEHGVIRKLTAALDKPVTCKRWHFAAALIVVFVLGLLF